MTMIRRDAPDQAEQGGTVHDADGSTRRFTTVAWTPFRNQAPKDQKMDRGYAFTITLAFIGIAAVAAATMYVSYEAQLLYTDAIKGGEEDTPSMASRLAAAAWDMAALVFAFLGLATAMRGDSALRARVGNLVCITASALMNGAQISVPEDASTLVWMGHILVWVGPPLLYAGTTDTIVHEVQRRAMERRGLPLNHASLLSVLAIIFRGAFGFLAWLLRLCFAYKQTKDKFKEWYLQEVPYAPGRTVAGDQAAAAELRAGSAEEIAERVRTESRAAVEAAEARADARIRQAEQDAQERMQQSDERAKAEIEAVTTEQTERADSEIAAERRLREQAKEQHREAVASLESETNRLRRELDRTATHLREARSEAEQGREYERRLTETRSALDRTERLRSEALATVRQHQQEVDILFNQLSGRQQVEHLYDRLARVGDPRHGDPRQVHQLAEEFLAQGVRVESANTVGRYLREYLSTSGPQMAGVAGGTDDSMGGAL